MTITDETQAPALDVAGVRAQFPILARTVHGRPLVYLDNAATTQKPIGVLEAIDGHYRLHNANVHRGVHRLSQEATDAFERARDVVARHLGADDARQVVFTRGVTEAINLVAQAWAGTSLRAGDEILLTGMEHHSNIVPWQLVAQRTGAIIRVLPVRDDGTLDIDRLDEVLTSRTRIVACVHVSNALGTVNPVAEIAARAREAGAITVIDGAQAMPHRAVDVRALGCDFYAFSGHKMYGPTGIGGLWGRPEHLAAMPPWQGGGEMIRSVSFEGTTYAEPPARFEAGTPNIAGAVGLAAAVEFLRATGLDAIAAHERRLLARATDAVADRPGLRIIGTAVDKAAVLSFTVEGVHPHDIGTALDHEGVAVRTGHHCTQPLMQRFGVAATTRASFACYNTEDEVDAFVAALGRVLEFFRP